MKKLNIILVSILIGLQIIDCAFTWYLIEVTQVASEYNVLASLLINNIGYVGLGILKVITACWLMKIVLMNKYNTKILVASALITIFYSYIVLKQIMMI